jgi:nicotinamide phosphoribosyltransferase
MNILLQTDVYKMGHMEQYNPDIEFIQSHLVVRNNIKYEEVVFFGLQYFIIKYLLNFPTQEDVNEFIHFYEIILKRKCPDTVKGKLYALLALGYWPVKIRAIDEGEVHPSKGTILMTIENTLPGFHWVVGFLEGLFLKIWNTSTVATHSYGLRKLFLQYAQLTGSLKDFIPYQVHDFGYRSVSSEETAALSGAAHLLSFRGTDTVPAVKLLHDYYPASRQADSKPDFGSSVPASEHSVMCSFGKERELEAFRHMLKTYPTGIVSIVSDTYNLNNVLTNFAIELKTEILERNGKVVFRPDSGEPVLTTVDAIMQLETIFGSTRTPLGFKVLNEKVGVIFGEGMTNYRIQETLEILKRYNFASQNLVVGVGGLLLQQHTRDDLGFSFKANWAKLKDGSEIALYKSSPGKQSYDLGYIRSSTFVRYEDVYLDGKLLKRHSIDDIRRTLFGTI